MTTLADDVLEGFRLGESETLLRLEGPEQMQKATLLLLSQAVRQVHIITPHLEADRFNTPEFADALSAFARRSRYAETRILVGDPSIAIRWGHRVVQLARRLPSLVQIRQLHHEDYNPEEAWIVADDIGLLRRDGIDGFLGMISAKSVMQAKKNNRRFKEIWERAHQVQEFREMHL